MGSFVSSLTNHNPAGNFSDDGDFAVVVVHSNADGDLHCFAHRDDPDKLVVIDFTTSWRDPCRQIKPVFKVLTLYADVALITIDVDELSEVLQQWKVQAMPTFVLTKGGKDVERVIGAKKDGLERKIQKHYKIGSNKKSL